MVEGRDEEVFADQVGEKAERMEESRRRGDGVWFWLGMTGIVGWSVTVPTVAGTMLGWWLDQRFAQAFSWTLSLMVLGLVMGCLNAWFWVRKGASDD